MDLGDNRMRSHRITRGRSGRRALVTAFCSLLVFAVGFGQAVLPANAGSPSLTMGQVSTGNSAKPAGPQTTRKIGQHVLVAAAATVAPNHVGINLEGCRNNGSITLPIAGKFVCPDAAYTSGNLGKGWNELDLVPHRVTTTAGSQAGTTTDYDFNITADGENGGHPGYDLLTVPEVNAAKSDASCSVSSSAQGAKTPGIGGTDTSIYRTLHVHQAKGTTCVIDWAERLALGSHLYPGSSLHSNLAQADFSTGGIGAQDVSIPVKEISPQELSKTETATQGAGNVWRVSKQATPTSINFPQTCNPNNPTSKTVQIDVTVTKTVQQSGNTIVHAEITATNPAHRIVDVTISDSIFEGAVGSSTLATALSGTNPKTFPLTSVAAESSVTLVHEIEVANGAANVYSDKATAVYTDHAFPNVQIPGNTTATAQANVAVNTSNADSSVVVTDLESISGNPDVQYRIDAGSATGTYAFNDGALETYAPGTTGYTTRPVLWTSGSVSQSTTFHFFKTVRVAKPTSGDATLADTATVLGDRGATLSTANASVAISTALDCPDVIVTKTAQKDVIDAGDTAAFTITVTNNGPGVAKNVTLSDPLPSGVAWQDDSAVCSISNGTLSCQFGDLNAGASRTVHVSGKTDQQDCKVLLNTATVSSSNEPEANQGNNSDSATITVLCPSLNLTKIADDQSVSAGDPIGYTITVTNSGQGAATDVVVSDTLPTNDGLSWSIDGGTGAQDCSITNGVLTCTFPSIAAGASVMVHLTSPTTGGTCGDVVNTASAISGNDGSPSTGPVTIAVDCPDLQVVKTADNGTISAGDPAAFTIVVTNNGPGVAKAASLTDTLPGGVDWHQDNADCSITAGVLTCDFGELASGATRTIHVSGTTDAADCGTLHNTASVSASNESQDELANNTSSAQIAVDCPDLQVVKTADNGTISAGDPAAFTIVVTNNGPGVAKAASLTDTLPGGVDWHQDNADCSITAGVLTCDFGELASGATRTIHVSGTTDAADCGTLHNTASVSASNESQDELANNTSSAQIAVDCPSISVTKTADDTTADAADQVGFTITVANAGPGTAKDVHLDDPLPTNPGLDWSIDGGTGQQLCKITQGDLVCDFGDMSAESSYSVHITSATDATTCGEIDNTATVTISNGDGDKASASIDVNCSPLGIDIVKSGPDLAHVGDTITYHFAVQLTTPETLFNVTVSDPNCNEDAPMYVSGDDGDNALEQGEVWQYECSHIVTDTDPDPLPNTATVQGTADDGRTTTDESSWSVELIHPAIKIVKTVNPISGNPGDTVTYTYVVTNTGDTTLYNISVDDDVIGHIGDLDQLEPGQSVTLTKDWILPADELVVTNVGTATGTDVLGQTVTDNDDANVTIVKAAHNPPKPPPPTAFTGSDAARLGLITLILLGLGAMALVIGRRRRDDTA